MKKILIIISLSLNILPLFTITITYAAYDFLPYHTGRESGVVFFQKIKPDLYYYKSHYKLYLFRCQSEKTKKINLYNEYIPYAPKISDDKSILFFYSMIESKDHISIIDLDKTKREIVSFNTSGYFINGNPCNSIKLTPGSKNSKNNKTNSYVTGAIFKRGAPLFSRSAYLIDITKSNVTEILKAKGLDNIFFNKDGSIIYLIEKTKDSFKIAKAFPNHKNKKTMAEQCLYYKYFSYYNILVYLKKNNVFIYDEKHDVTLQLPLTAINPFTSNQFSQNNYFRLYNNTMIIHYNNNLYFYKVNKGFDNKCVLPLGREAKIFFYAKGLSIIKDHKLFSFTVNEIEMDNVDLTKKNYTKIPVWMKQIEIIDHDYGFLLDGQQVWILTKFNEILPTNLKNIKKMVKIKKIQEYVFLLLQKQKSPDKIYQGLYYLSQNNNQFTEISHIPENNLTISTFHE